MVSRYLDQEVLHIYHVQEIKGCLLVGEIFIMRNSADRKEGNDKESIQLPNTFRSKTPKGKKDALKVTAPQSKHHKQKPKTTVSSQKWPKGYPK